MFKICILENVTIFKNIFMYVLSIKFARFTTKKVKYVPTHLVHEFSLITRNINKLIRSYICMVELNETSIHPPERAKRHVDENDNFRLICICNYI